MALFKKESSLVRFFLLDQLPLVAKSNKWKIRKDSPINPINGLNYILFQLRDCMMETLLAKDLRALAPPNSP